MEVYKSKYLHIAYFAGQGLLEMTWLSETKMMYIEECKQEFLNCMEVVRQQRPTCFLVDSSNMFFTFSPKMQDWINQTVFTPSLNMGINKVAFVVSKDFFALLSTKQTMTESAGLKHTTEYFDTKEAAKKWVLSVS